MNPPKPYYQADGITIYHADCFEVLHTLAGVGAFVTDVPYSSGGAFRGDRMASTLSKYASSDSTQQQGIGFTGDNRDQRAFLAWCSLWMSAARAAAVEGATFATFHRLATATDDHRRDPGGRMGMERRRCVVEEIRAPARRRVLERV